MSNPKRRSKKRDYNIFTWLDEVRECPSMYMLSLHDLESQICGYYYALRNHRIVEPVPRMCLHFLFWLRYRMRWETSCGFATAIETEISDPKKQLDTFFSLVDEYRQLKPTILCTARLGKQHKSSYPRIRMGLDSCRKETPKRMDIVRYVPEPLYLLRFHYLNEIIDDDFLYNSDASLNTTIYKAKKWAFDKLHIKRDEWQKVT